MTIDINELNNKIPPHIRHITAVKNRDYREAADRGIQDERFDMSLECFNNSDLQREPDSIGITLAYPAKGPKTHVLTRFWPIGIGEKELLKQVRAMKKDLIDKIPGAK